MYMRKILLLGVFVIATLLTQGFALAEAQYLNEYPTFFEDDEVIPEGVPQPAVID